MNTRRPELRLVVDTNGTWDGLAPVPIYLDRPTLGAAFADAEAAVHAVVAGARGADVRSLSDPAHRVPLRP